VGTSERAWTTLWDRKGRRVLLLAGPPAGGSGHATWWSPVQRDAAASVQGQYDLWRSEEGHVVFVEIHLDANDMPLGFPPNFPMTLLGSPTIWPMPDYHSFMWWHPASEE
jgi:hypothetical protein